MKARIIHGELIERPRAGVIQHQVFSNHDTFNIGLDLKIFIAAFPVTGYNPAGSQRCGYSKQVVGAIAFVQL